MKHGFVLLSDRDTDAPRLPSVCTVSKYDAWPGADTGALALGVLAAQNGALWIDRPYWVGNPDPAWLAQKAHAAIEMGGLVQLGNEQNHPIENWLGGPDALHDLYGKVRALLRADQRSKVIAAPPSPGFDGWQAWVNTAAAKHGVHCYGSFDQMRAIVEWFLTNTAADLYVTECNPGAGNTFDLDAWAVREFVPFLNWCAAQPRVQAVAYFAWRWNESATLPSSVDGAGTAVERVLREFTPAAIKPPDSAQEPTMPDYATVSIAGCDVLDVRDRFPYVNGEYDTRDVAAISTFVQHHSVTAMPVGQDAALAVLDAIQKWHTGTPPNGNGWPAIGYHFAIDGAGRVYWLNALNLVSYHARIANTYGIGVVWLGTFEKDPPPDVMVDASRRLYLGLAKHLGRNLALVGHHEVKTNETSCPGKGHWARTKQAILRQQTPITPKLPNPAAYEAMAWSRLNAAGQWLIAHGDGKDKDDGRAVIALMDLSKKRHGA